MLQGRNYVFNRGTGTVATVRRARAVGSSCGLSPSWWGSKAVVDNYRELQIVQHVEEHEESNESGALAGRSADAGDLCEEEQAAVVRQVAV